MLRALFIASATALAACSAGVVDGPSASPRASSAPAVPTTRLVLPTSRPRRALDCVDFTDQVAAQAALRMDPTDPDHLDADADGIACEHLAR